MYAYIGVLVFIGMHRHASVYIGHIGVYRCISPYISIYRYISSYIGTSVYIVILVYISMYCMAIYYHISPYIAISPCIGIYWYISPYIGIHRHISHTAMTSTRRHRPTHSSGKGGLRKTDFRGTSAQLPRRFGFQKC